MTRINRYSRLVLAAAGLWLLSGCGTDHTPTASTPGATQPSSRMGYISFAAGPGAHGAAKIAYDLIGPALRETKTITPNGGSVRLVENGGSGGEDNLKAELNVSAGALNQDTDITMALQGSTLADILIGFAPDGLVFNTPAELWLKVGPALVDLPTETMVALHTDSNGVTQEVPILQLFERDGATWVVIQVPGFSVYSLGGGNP